MKTKEKKAGRGEHFVETMLERIHGKAGAAKPDHALAAALKRADNPATEYQSWEYLAGWCDLEAAWERIPFTVIGAALARAKPARDGTLGLGRAIAGCYDDGNQNDQARQKLRRVLACDSIEEVCSVLRPLLSLITSHGMPLAYGRLLRELLWFSANPQRTRLGWAADFFGRQAES